jgi:hypothetical protein
MIFNPGVELGPVDGSGWNFSPVCNTKLYQNQTRDHMTECSTQCRVQPWGWNLTLLHLAELTPGWTRPWVEEKCCHVIVSTQGWNYSWAIRTCVVVWLFITRKQNGGYSLTAFFYFRGYQCRERIAFQPGVEIVHVIAKHFNPVNRAEFNPGVESCPCNRPLRNRSKL